MEKQSLHVTPGGVRVLLYFSLTVAPFVASGHKDGLGK